MINFEARERLHQLFAGYFHEDFYVEFGSASQALSAFIRQHRSDADFVGLARDIVAYVDEYPDDDTLDEALFKELGCYYLARADGISTRSWLLEVAARLEREGTS